MIRDPHRILLWVIQKIGILTLVMLFLLIVVYGSLIYGVSENIRGLETDLLSPFVFVGLIFGWLLARSTITGKSYAILVLSTGIILVLLRVGGLIAPLIVTIQALSHTTMAILNRQVDFSPLLVAITELGFSSSALFNRLSNWIWGLLSGEPSFDAIPIAILWSLVIWCLAVWASWAVRRLHRPLLGILPAGILLAVTLNYVRGSTMVLLPMIGGALLLTALLHHSNQVRSWDLK